MKLLFDFLPIIVFFITYKFFGIYVATISVIVISVLQVLIYWFKYRRIDKMILVTAASAIILGGVTLMLHDEIYIKWKPTVIYWLLAALFIGSKLVTGKSLIQSILEANINLPKHVWYRLNWVWAAFFLAMGLLNLYVVYNYSTNTWVNFKLVGILGLTLIFVIAQSLYLTRYIQPDDKKNSKKE
jgi:intracellular septation protein